MDTFPSDGHLQVYEYFTSDNQSLADQIEEHKYPFILKLCVQIYIEHPDNEVVRRCPRIGEWDVSRVTDMSQMFEGYVYFNEDISKWNMSNTTKCIEMFQDCYSFNQPLNSWDCSRMRDCKQMFRNCVSFNQPLDQWNTSSFQFVSEMFLNCRSFNQNLNSWQLPYVVSRANIFKGCTRLSPANWSILNERYLHIPAQLIKEPAPEEPPEETPLPAGAFAYRENNYVLPNRHDRRILPLVTAADALREEGSCSAMMDVHNRFQRVDLGALWMAICDLHGVDSPTCIQRVNDLTITPALELHSDFFDFLRTTLLLARVSVAKEEEAAEPRIQDLYLNYIDAVFHHPDFQSRNEYTLQNIDTAVEHHRLSSFQVDAKTFFYAWFYLCIKQLPFKHQVRYVRNIVLNNFAAYAEKNEDDDSENNGISSAFIDPNIGDIACPMGFLEHMLISVSDLLFYEGDALLAPNFQQFLHTCSTIFGALSMEHIDTNRFIAGFVDNCMKDLAVHILRRRKRNPAYLRDIENPDQYLQPDTMTEEARDNAHHLIELFRQCFRHTKTTKHADKRIVNNVFERLENPFAGPVRLIEELAFYLEKHMTELQGQYAGGGRASRHRLKRPRSLASRR